MYNKDKELVDMSKKDKVCRGMMIALMIFFIVDIGCVTLRLITEKDMTTTEQYIDVGSVLSIHGDVIVVDVNGEMYEFYGSDLSIGQRLAIGFNDNGTTDKKDDIIVDVVLME